MFADGGLVERRYNLSSKPEHGVSYFDPFLGSNYAGEDKAPQFKRLVTARKLKVGKGVRRELHLFTHVRLDRPVFGAFHCSGCKGVYGWVRAT